MVVLFSVKKIGFTNQPTVMKKIILSTALLFATFYATYAQTTPEDKDRKAELVNQVLSIYNYTDAQILDKLFTFNISSSFWEKLDDPDAKNSNHPGTGEVHSLVSDLIKYAKLENIEDLTQYDPKDKSVRPLIDQQIQEVKKRFSMVINAPMDAIGRGYEMFLRFPYQTMNRLGSGNPPWSPAGGEAHFIVNLSTTAKDMSVKTSDGGKTYTITGPVYVEAYDTQGKIDKGLNLTNKNN